jgi:Flp pilus assembly protein protease CpaA
LASLVERGRAGARPKSFVDTARARPYSAEVGEVFVAPFVWHVVAFAPVGVAIAVCDWRAFVIPDRLVIVGVGLVLAARFAWPIGSWWAAAGTTAFACGVFAVARVVAGGKLGWGDVKLSGLIGLTLGGLGWLVAMFIACLAALVWVFVAYRGHDWQALREARIPFGSFMVGGALASGVLLALLALDGGYVV